MRTRRSVIKTMSSMASLSIVGVANTAAKQTAPVGDLEQIDKEVAKAYGQDGPFGIKQVMERRGLEYDFSANNLNDSEVSPQRRFHQYDLSSNKFKVDDETVRIQLIADLRDLKIGFSDATYVDDIMGLSYRTEHWTSVATSIRTPSEYHDIDPWEGSLNGGYAVRVKLSPEGIVREDDAMHTFLTAVSLKNETGSPNTVIGHYAHNSAPSPTGQVKGISAGGVGMNINVSIGANTFWQEGHDVEVEEASIFD